MNTRNLLTLMAFGGVVALVACTSSLSDDKFGSSDSFCSAKAEAECMQLAKKCGAPTVEACKTKRTSTCNSAAGAATATGRGYRSSAAQACIDSINDTYKDNAANVTPDTEVASAKVCDRVFRGSKKERESCSNTFECEGSLICDSVCATEQAAKQGEGCGNAGQVCEKGTYCQDQGGKKFCNPKNKEGDTCTSTSPCIETLRCVNHCVAKVVIGQPCSTDDECSVDAPLCDQASSPKKCRIKYESTTAACKEFGSSI